MIPIVADLPPQQEAAKHVEYMNRLPSHIDNGLYTINLPEGYGKKGPVSRYGFGDSLFEMPQVKIPVKDEPPDDVPKAEEILPEIDDEVGHEGQIFTPDEFSNSKYGDAVAGKSDAIKGMRYGSLDSVESYRVIDTSGFYTTILAETPEDSLYDHLLFISNDIGEFSTGGELLNLTQMHIGPDEKPEIVDLYKHESGKFVSVVKGPMNSEGEERKVIVIRVYDPLTGKLWVKTNHASESYSAMHILDNMDGDKNLELGVWTSKPTRGNIAAYKGSFGVYEKNDVTYIREKHSPLSVTELREELLNGVPAFENELEEGLAVQIAELTASNDTGRILEVVKDSPAAMSALSVAVLGGDELQRDLVEKAAISQTLRDSTAVKASLVRTLVDAVRLDPRAFVSLAETYLYERGANANISLFLNKQGVEYVDNTLPRVDTSRGDIEIYRHQGKDLDWHKIPRDVQVAIERGVITGDQADVLRDMPDVNERTVSNGRNSNNGSNSSASSRGFDPNNDPLAEKRAADREAAYQALRDMEEIGTQIEKGVNDTVRGLQDALGWK